ncbi:uncharacterized protein SETTUDRAFT_88822 [Exserohilum turcica Et28A]|uniref:Uncharacterized protein n=1 Tax=Exserohilum turcicum (strain 28A) TaxID=671987 RepID=R0IPM8_EXST2|nr:uncharacterized protein SETTUDRAFT_88822 [Exserohilum turcica Et28A]EOA86656.1 hypothetical protein SETTUDRAFT_88822 [Exserohilum turcica Et28A]
MSNYQLKCLLTSQITTPFANTKDIIVALHNHDLTIKTIVVNSINSNFVHGHKAATAI